MSFACPSNLTPSHRFVEQSLRLLGYRDLKTEVAMRPQKPQFDS